MELKTWDELEKEYEELRELFRLATGYTVEEWKEMVREEREMMVKK